MPRSGKAGREALSPSHGGVRRRELGTSEAFGQSALKQTKNRSDISGNGRVGSSKGPSPHRDQKDKRQN